MTARRSIEEVVGRDTRCGHPPIGTGRRGGTVIVVGNPGYVLSASERCKAQCGDTDQAAVDSILMGSEFVHRSLSVGETVPGRVVGARATGYFVSRAKLWIVPVRFV
jgi:hypothetical protein